MSHHPQLSPVEARVIAALAEKSIATPQYYPMTVNAIMLACNQKTARHPVMSLSEGEVGNALNSLEDKKLIARDAFSGRVQKWRHQFQHQLLLKSPEFALLLTLILRGPQTAAELRANAAGIGGPGDIAALHEALTSLNDRAEPMLVALPRAPGQKEARYAHCLCGQPQDATEFSLPDAPAEATPSASHTALEARVAQLEARIAAMEAALGIGS